MLQMMMKKVEAEGEKEKELFDKFMCYCKNADATLGKSIGDAETKIPQLQSDLKEAVATKAQLEADIKQHQNDRTAANEAMAKATEMREKEAAAFAKEDAEAKANLEALKKATAAIEKGMAGGFLQTAAAAVLRRIVMTQDMISTDRDALSNFLSQGDGNSNGYAPASGEIVGILKQMTDTMMGDLKDMMAAKQKEVDALTKAIEEKIKRLGEVGIEIVNLKEEIEDTSESLLEDKKFLADLEKNCANKEKEWAERCKMRQMELLAL